MQQMPLVLSFRLRGGGGDGGVYPLTHAEQKWMTPSAMGTTGKGWSNQAKDKASVQINVGHVGPDGVYTGEFTTMALCGFVRGMGEADGAFDRLWTKCYENSKGSI